MQYTKLGFSRLFNGCGSHQVLCSLIVNRSVTPTLHIANVGFNAETSVPNQNFRPKFDLLKIVFLSNISRILSQLRRKTKTADFIKVCGIETQTNIAADFELVCGKTKSEK